MTVEITINLPASAVAAGDEARVDEAAGVAATAAVSAGATDGAPAAPSAPPVSSFPEPPDHGEALDVEGNEGSLDIPAGASLPPGIEELEFEFGADVGDIPPPDLAMLAAAASADGNGLAPPGLDDIALAELLALSDSPEVAPPDPADLAPPRRSRKSK